MLRPATPLSIIFFVAFVLLLLGTLSTPIIHAIPLGSYGGYNFGVFGYCKGNTCSPFRLGYTTEGLFPDDKSFELPTGTRRSLSSILIVHPIAAFFALICFGLAIAAHFRSAAHSPRYLLALLIFTIPTLLITLLAFLVDILLFVPHMQWGGWIMLAATILIMASSIVTCAMRRTLVSRKARKKRIAENAEMNGTNYYENLNAPRIMPDETLPRADSPPPMSGANEADKNGQFATFEMKRQDTRSENGQPGRRSMDDQTPLNPMRDPSIRSTSTGGGPRRHYGNGEDAPPMPMGPGGRGDGMRGPPRRPSRDQYGNIIAGGAMGAAAGEMLPPPRLRHQGSQGSMGSNGSGNGYPPRGRGGYGPPPPGRGRGYGPPRGGRGGYGPPRGGYRGQGPPPGWNGRGRGGYGPPPGMMGRGGGPRPGPPPGYGSNGSYGPPRGDLPPPPQDEFIAGPMIGQAIEMDDRTGQTSPQYATHHDTGDMQHDSRNIAQPMGMESHTSQEPAAMPSAYPQDSYVPPRAQWAGAQRSESPSHRIATPPLTDVSPIYTGDQPQYPPAFVPKHTRGNSEPYYEDVDPRFAIDPASEVSQADQHTALPSTLTPGGFGSNVNRTPISPNHLHPLATAPTDGSNRSRSTPSLEERPSSRGNNLNATEGSYENLPAGARSPGEGSDTSHFTSVSQRGINPNWRPNSNMGPPGSMAGPKSSASAQQRRKEDVILGQNPDFMLPNLSPGGRGGRGRGGGPGGMSRNASGPMGLTPNGRYPNPTDV